MDDGIVRAVKCARRYREMGLSPLPSATDRKKPTLAKYAEYREKPLEGSYFNTVAWATPNVQLMTGVRAYGSKKIIVVDCDGEPAKEKWRKICACHQFTPRTWKVATGGGGQHWYFEIPEGVKEVQSGMVWGMWDSWGDSGAGCWMKHQEVRILGEGSLAVAPPSVHIETHKRYKFDSVNPVETPVPEVAPAWLLNLPRLSKPTATKSCVNTISEAPRLRPLGGSVGRRYEREAVLSSIPDKMALAASWGLRLAQREPSASGWMTCYAVGRDEKTPSGSFNAESGIYRDWVDDGKSNTFFDLGVLLGRFANWHDCRDWCGEQYMPNPYRQAIANRGRNGVAPAS